MAVKEPSLRSLVVLAASRVILGLAALVGLILIAGAAGLAVRLFTIAAGF